MSDEFEAFTPKIGTTEETLKGSTDETFQPSASTDLACEVCGTPLVYGGRGRKPRFCDEHKAASSSRPRAGAAPRGGSGAQVEQAVQVLAGLYEGLNLAFFLADPTGRASQEWVGNVTKLHDQNRQFLSQNPKLAKQIVKMGTSTGTAGFVFAQGMAVLPPAAIAFAAVKERRAENLRAAKSKPVAQPQGPARPGGRPVPPEQDMASKAAQFDPGQVPEGNAGYTGPNAGFFG